MCVCVCVVLLLLLFLLSFIVHSSHCGKFGSSYLGKATPAARAALPIPCGACSVLVLPNNGRAASAWDLKRANATRRQSPALSQDQTQLDPSFAKQKRVNAMVRTARPLRLQGQHDSFIDRGSE